MVWHLSAETVVFCYNTFCFFCAEMVAFWQILHKNMPNSTISAQKMETIVTKCSPYCEQNVNSFALSLLSTLFG